MPYNVLLLPLIGGFLFVHLTHYFRFRAQRADGYRLLFQAAIAGILLSAVGRVAELLLHLTPLGMWIETYWNMFSPFPYSETSAVAFLLGPLFALLVNLFVDKDKARTSEIRLRGDFLQKLLDQAALQKRLISLTLDSRKWYVGWVVETPNLDPRELYFKLLPFISGYRDKDTLETRRIVYYDAVLKDATLSPYEFALTLPLKDVKIAGFFNEEIYDEYFSEPADGSTPPMLVN